MKPQVAILDYGCGNLRSVVNAVREVGGEPLILREGDVSRNATHIIMPGQGHFGVAAESLRYFHWGEPRKPVLGICLGMQLMCQGSEEAPGVKGLDWIEGTCRRLDAPRVPHVGWERVVLPLVANPRHEDGQSFYFCHNYALYPDQPILDNRGGWDGAFAEYGDKVFLAIVISGNVWAVQFHPEKSGKAGLAFLREFLAL